MDDDSGAVRGGAQNLGAEFLKKWVLRDIPSLGPDWQTKYNQEVDEEAILSASIDFFSNIFDFIQNWIGGNLIVFEAWIKMIRHFQSYENDIMIYGSDPLRNNVWDFVKNIESIRPHRLHTWEI